MSIIDLLFTIIIILMVIEAVCIAISIVDTEHLVKDLDLKTWERIEGRRK